MKAPFEPPISTRSETLALFCVILLCCLAPVQAERIGGFVRVDCPAGSDTIVSVPFHQEAVYLGELSGAPALNGDQAVLSLTGTPDFSDDELVLSPSYVRFTAGVRSGCVFAVVANGAASVTVDLKGVDSSGIDLGDELKIIPYWTLDSVFPPGTQETVHLSSSAFASGRKTEIQFFDANSNGTELAPDQIYFLQGATWRQAVKGFPAAGEKVIPPGSSFLIRHPGTVVSTSFVSQQWVDTEDFVTPLETSDATAKDISVGLVRPVPVSLSELGLTTANGFVESPSPDPVQRKDELHLFDNADATINKLPSAVYFRTGGNWVLDDGNSYPLSNDVSVSPGAGLLIRKSLSNDGATHVWINTPSY